MYALSNMPSGVLYGRVAVDVAQLPEAEPVAVVAGIGKTVHYHRRTVAMEHFTHPTVQLVVGDGGPEGLLLVGHRLHIRHGGRC